MPGPSPVTTSSDSYLDQTKTKKRKADNNAPATANKKQKVDAMASTHKEQLYKSLTNAQKEPFKEEQRIAQVTARKAKLSAKKAKDMPNTN
ncbi:hypothetical protein BJY52DRAFT_1197171 [Lactarius psammicola]|nr:hypothetical protein BJY52DRAFT_1197171 [Lactarius psammicola]